MDSKRKPASRLFVLAGGLGAFGGLETNGQQKKTSLSFVFFWGGRGVGGLWWIRNKWTAKENQPLVFLFWRGVWGPLVDWKQMDSKRTPASALFFFWGGGGELGVFGGLETNGQWTAKESQPLVFFSFFGGRVPFKKKPA